MLESVTCHSVTRCHIDECFWEKSTSWGFELECHGQLFKQTNKFSVTKCALVSSGTWSIWEGRFGAGLGRCDSESVAESSPLTVESLLYHRKVNFKLVLWDWECQFCRELAWKAVVEVIQYVVYALTNQGFFTKQYRETRVVMWLRRLTYQKVYTALWLMRRALQITSRVCTFPKSLLRDIILETSE